jgi:hypothetical protein
MFSSTGNLHYGPGIRIIVSIDQGIVDYYRNLIPKHHNVQPQKYGAHVTVLRTGVEQPTNLAVWGKHQGASVLFDYSPEIQYDGTYWFLNATSQKIGDIREELGLPRFRFPDRPYYHISLGNTK